jgi:hypothetical protein
VSVIKKANIKNLKKGDVMISKKYSIIVFCILVVVIFSFVSNAGAEVSGAHPFSYKENVNFTTFNPGTFTVEFWVEDWTHNKYQKKDIFIEVQ